MLRLMRDMLKLIWWVVIGLFRSRASLEAEIVALRHQLNVLRRKSTKRLAFSNFDRLIFAGLYHCRPVKNRIDSTGYWIAGMDFRCRPPGRRGKARFFRMSGLTKSVEKY